MKKTIALLIATTALASPAIAEDLSVVGSWSSLPLHKQYEAPFWTTTLPEASGGNINVELTTHNAMSLGLGDIYPLLGQGVYDVAMTVADYAVSDAPELEGLDVPLLALTADEARAMVDAARPMVADIYRDRFVSHQGCSRLLRLRKCAYHAPISFQAIFGIDYSRKLNDLIERFAQ